MAQAEVPETTLPRRRFLVRLSLGLASLGAAIVAIPAVAFILRGMFRVVPQQWRDLGPASRFAIGATVQVAFESAHSDRWARESAKSGAWLRRDGADRFTAFSMHCTHMGCPVRWQAEASLFMCPCHGGVYHADGTVAAGPPLHPLTRYPVRIRNDRIEIGTDVIPMS